MQAEFPIFTISNPPTIVPVVLPPSADRSLSGKIRNLSVRGADHSGWLEGTRAGWKVNQDRAISGYILLEDLYRAEGNEEGWLQYKRYLSDWRRGTTTRPFPFHLLPQEVQRRQNGEVGVEHTDPWNIPAPTPTTGVTTEGTKKAK